MDKKIRKIEKEVKKIKNLNKKGDTKHSAKEITRAGKDLKQLEKMDKKRDPACDLGKEIMKKKKK